jgi:hypothetical protein
VLLRDHAAAAVRADEVAELHGRGVDAYEAADVYADCVPLAVRDESLTPDARRDFAARYADRAVALLRLAVQRGYRDVGAARKNGSFDAFRDRADFQQVLTDMAGRAP